MLSKVKYCNNCNQTVNPKKNVSYIALVLLLLFLIIPGIIYLIYCLLVQNGKCPICGGKNWRNVGSEDLTTADFQLPDLKKKPLSFLCAGCNIAFPTEADLYNHDMQKHGGQSAPHRVEEEEDEFYEEEEEVVVEAPVEEEKKTREKISFRERLKNSPSLQGVLIGLILVMMVVSISMLAMHQSFVVANDALVPDVNKGEIIKYQKIPLSKIKKNDIIAFVDPTGEFDSKIGKVRSIDTHHITDEVVRFKTSNNTSPQKLYSVPAESVIGKITDVYYIPVPFIFGNGFVLVLIATFVAPIIILKIRKRLLN